jgi:acetyl-CoA carboxylase biotin carboxyl carrier protein
MDFNQIQELIRLVSKSKVSEFIFKEGDFKLVIRNQNSSDHVQPQLVMQAPQPIVTMAAPPQIIASAPIQAQESPALAPVEKSAPAADASNAKYITIKSPMVGTFYRSASPDKPPYIKIGDSVNPGMAICMIEAMKLFNEIECEVKGKIMQILVDDAKPVEYDQPLFLVDPS